MLIFDDYSHPIILDNIHGPTVSEYMWVLDLSMMDFALAPITMLEEVVCPSIQIQIDGFEFILPANWNILVYDTETSQVDVVELSETAGREFTAMVGGPTKTQPIPCKIIATNYYVEYKNVGPSLNKHQMLCHPINKDMWCCIGPSDGFNKYLKNAIAGDLF